MYFVLGGYIRTPEQIRAWFNEKGVNLEEHLYMVKGNRYLREKGLAARIRSCDYEGKHSFLVLTHQGLVEDSVAMSGNFTRISEDAYALSVKKEMGLENVDFVTITDYAG